MQLYCGAKREAKVAKILLASHTKQIPLGLIIREWYSIQQQPHLETLEGQKVAVVAQRELLLALVWGVLCVCCLLHSCSQEKGDFHFTSCKLQISNSNDYLENVTHKGSNTRRWETRTPLFITFMIFRDSPWLGSSPMLFGQLGLGARSRAAAFPRLLSHPWPRETSALPQ